MAFFQGRYWYRLWEKSTRLKTDIVDWNSFAVKFEISLSKFKQQLIKWKYNLLKY